MQSLSYNISPPIKQSLQKIETMRRQIVLSPLPPSIEIRLRWEATISRIQNSLYLSNNRMRKQDVVNLLNKQNSLPVIVKDKKKFASNELDVLHYKQALDYIYQNWLLSDKPVTSQTVVKLHSLASEGRLKSSESSMREMLNFLQANPENPIIPASIAYSELVRMKPFTKGNARTARLLALLLLYKYGYDFRGLLVLEKYWRENMLAFNQQYEKVAAGGSITLWLEFIMKGLIASLEEIIRSLDLLSFQTDMRSSYFELNDRQKAILATLDQPGSAITNKKVQSVFGVSQITASRDLARLASVGLLFAHGKGRSIYYTQLGGST